MSSIISLFLGGIRTICLDCGRVISYLNPCDRDPPFHYSRAAFQLVLSIAGVLLTILMLWNGRVTHCFTRQPNPFPLSLPCPLPLPLPPPFPLPCPLPLPLPLSLSLCLSLSLSLSLYLSLYLLMYSARQGKARRASKARRGKKKQARASQNEQMA